MNKLLQAIEAAIQAAESVRDEARQSGRAGSMVTVENAEGTRRILTALAILTQTNDGVHTNTDAFYMETIASRIINPADLVDPWDPGADERAEQRAVERALASDARAIALDAVQERMLGVRERRVA